MTSFSITVEEHNQLEIEYQINDTIVYLQKAAEMVGGTCTINDAIKVLLQRTRFKDQLIRSMNQTNTAKLHD